MEAKMKKIKFTEKTIFFVNFNFLILSRAAFFIEFNPIFRVFFIAEMTKFLP